MKAKDMPYLTKKSLRKKITDLCKKSSTCPHCGAANGVVKKCGLLKISHEKFRNQKKNRDRKLIVFIRRRQAVYKKPDFSAGELI